MCNLYSVTKSQTAIIEASRAMRPFFAGLWTPWTGVRATKANPIEGEHTLFGFLTTEANDVVGAIHPKVMPVILTSPEEIATWMDAPAEEALRLQQPLPGGQLTIVARGERK